eukprot:TRINITY_DN14847_c0_g1_i1.p1 TRINITY_DN14847_c0_g1~~TRINITY_DN14847_c0_g1_i1.p1  ORF type:complete len:358 (+),score=95.25 TRINITY_DN14847_c0_g1_i1:92-1075(+)
MPFSYNLYILLVKNPRYVFQAAGAVALGGTVAAVQGRMQMQERVKREESPSMQLFHRGLWYISGTTKIVAPGLTQLAEVATSEKIPSGQYLACTGLTGEGGGSLRVGGTAFAKKGEDWRSALDRALRRGYGIALREDAPEPKLFAAPSPAAGAGECRVALVSADSVAPVPSDSAPPAPARGPDDYSRQLVFALHGQQQPLRVLLQALEVDQGELRQGDEAPQRGWLGWLRPPPQPAPAPAQPKDFLAALVDSDALHLITRCVAVHGVDRVQFDPEDGVLCLAKRSTMMPKPAMDTGTMPSKGYTIYVPPHDYGRQSTPMQEGINTGH